MHDKITDEASENAIVRATAHLKEANGNMIYTDRRKLVVVDGVDDYIIVDKENVLLIFPKSKEQDIKKTSSRGKRPIWRGVHLVEL